MKQSSLFDAIAPIMIGPSSSHTAGAVRLGLLAKNIYQNSISKITFVLYNSYAQTGFGHGTDKGLLAGVLGFSVDDIRIKDIFNSPKAKSVNYNFEYREDFNRHPNAVDFIFEKGSRKMEIYGESVGAGEVVVRKIDGFTVKLTGKYNTLMLVYEDVPGMISKVTSLIQEKNINIASLHCDRYAKGEEASMCICIDGDLTTDVIDVVKKIEKVYFVSYIKKLED